MFMFDTALTEKLTASCRVQRSCRPKDVTLWCARHHNISTKSWHLILHATTDTRNTSARYKFVYFSRAIFSQVRWHLHFPKNTRSVGQNQIAIRFNCYLNRIDYLTHFKHYMIRFKYFMIRYWFDSEILASWFKRHVIWWRNRDIPNAIWCLKLM